MPPRDQPPGEGAPLDVQDLPQRLWRALGPDAVCRLAAIFRKRRLRRGDPVVAEGRETPEIGYVCTGSLAMVKRLDDGRRHIVGLLMHGDMYGRLFEVPSDYRIEALTDADVLTCERAQLEQLLGQNPKAEQAFLVDVLDELETAREWILVLGGPKIVQRFASFLLILARREIRGQRPAGRSGPLRVQVPIRRADLARYLGARPESLSRAAHELADLGLVRIIDADCFDLLDTAGLVEAAGQDLLIDDFPR